MLSDGWPQLRKREAEIIGFNGSVLPPIDEGTDQLSAVLAVPLERIYFVGADPQRDIDPAVRAGMQAVWLRNGQGYPPDLFAPAFEIESLDDLLELLREPYTRSLLGLRYILHSVAGWRPGKFIPGAKYGLREARKAEAQADQAQADQGSSRSGSSRP
jgi:hypothetical protein